MSMMSENQRPPDGVPNSDGGLTCARQTGKCKRWAVVLIVSSWLLHGICRFLIGKSFSHKFRQPYPIYSRNHQRIYFISEITQQTNHFSTWAALPLQNMDCFTILGDAHQSILIAISDEPMMFQYDARDDISIKSLGSSLKSCIWLRGYHHYIKIILNISLITSTITMIQHFESLLRMIIINPVQVLMVRRIYTHDICLIYPLNHPFIGDLPWMYLWFSCDFPMASSILPWEKTIFQSPGAFHAGNGWGHGGCWDYHW